MTSHWDHPFRLALRELFEDDSNGVETLREIMTQESVQSICTYAVSADGKALFLHTPGTGKKTKLLRGFGGGQHPNTALARLNSLRLELMDEGSLIWNDENIKASTPIMVADHPDANGKFVFYQAVQLTCNDGTVGPNKRPLFSYEAARDHYWFALGGQGMPSGLDEAIEALPGMPWKFDCTVVRYTWQEFLRNQEWGWRQCDYYGIKLMRSMIEEMVSGVHMKDAFVAHHTATEGAKRLAMQLNSLEPIAYLARTGWEPIMWEHAKWLRNFHDLVAEVGGDESMAGRPTGDATLMEHYGVPTDDAFSSAASSVSNMWIPVLATLGDTIVPARRIPGKPAVGFWCKECKCWPFAIQRTAHAEYEFLNNGRGCAHKTAQAYGEDMRLWHEHALATCDDPRGDLPGRWRDKCEKWNDAAGRSFLNNLDGFDLKTFIDVLTPWLFEFDGEGAWNRQPTIVHNLIRGAGPCIVYSCTKGENEAANKGRRSSLYHGTWLYAARNLIHEMRIRMSTNQALGHDFSVPGTYSSPESGTAISYARPGPLPCSNQNRLFCCMFQLKVNVDEKRSRKKEGGDQCIFVDDLMSMVAVIIVPNLAPSSTGDEYFRTWSHDLEIIPKQPCALGKSAEPRKRRWHNPLRGSEGSASSGVGSLPEDRAEPQQNFGALAAEEKKEAAAQKEVPGAGGKGGGAPPGGSGAGGGGGGAPSVGLDAGGNGGGAGGGGGVPPPPPRPPELADEWARRKANFDKWFSQRNQTLETHPVQLAFGRQLLLAVHQCIHEQDRLNGADLTRPQTLQKHEKFVKTKTMELTRYFQSQRAALLFPISGSSPWTAKSPKVVDVLTQYLDKHSTQWQWSDDVLTVLKPLWRALALESVRRVRTNTDETNHGHIVTNEDKGGDFALALQWTDRF